jgi:hypothetical protein
MAVSWLQNSYHPPAYVDVMQGRREWRPLADLYARPPTDALGENEPGYRCWVVTYASQMNTQLESLLMSAAIAGVEITVCLPPPSSMAL